MNSRFAKAFELANEMHKNQKRKGSNLPYISHLMAVSSLSMEACSKANMNEVLEDVAIGALFHDLIEDQGDKINLNEIKEQFGELVAKIVFDCSDAEITKENKQKPEWSIRKQKYIDAISHKCKESLIVSSADKLHNARSILSDKQLIGEDIWNRFSASKEQTIWYYNEVYKALDKAWGENPLLNELKQAINELR